MTKREQAALVAALKAGDIQKVRTFLDRQWNPSEFLNGENPLSFCKSADIAKILVRAGANVELGKNDWTPLHVNCDMGNERMVALLIKVGANVNRAYSKAGDAQVRRGTTPLMRASTHGYLGIVRLLLRSGADMAAVDEDGHNALFHAARGNQLNVASELLRRGSKLTHDVLTGPVFAGNVRLTKLLVEEGASVDEVFPKRVYEKMWPSDETLLGHAVLRSGSMDYPKTIVELLLKAGANPNRTTMWFCSQRKGEKLLPTVAPIQPLRIAGSRGRRDLMELLWKYGARGTLKDAMMDCSLERAVFRNSRETIHLLIEAGLDVNAIGAETGKRPLEIALEKGLTDVVEILRRAGAKE